MHPLTEKKLQSSTSAIAIGTNGYYQVPQFQSVKILGYNISRWSPLQQFIICSFGVFFFFLLYGYFQELMFIQPSIKSHGLYLTFYQFVLFSIFAWIECYLEGIKEKKIPMATYVVLSLLTVATMALSNSSLQYLNFPTQVIFKSCKLIPVLVGGILIQGKKYGLVDFIAACIMCIGLIWFTLADSHISPNFHPSGIIMISLALLADAMIGNVQEKAMKKFAAPNCEVVLYSYSLGLIYLGIALVISGQLLPSIRLSNLYPLEMYGYGFLFSLTGYLGVSFVLTLVRTVGAFAAVTVTTFRKSITIALSFYLFAKPFTMQYVWSSLLVLFGVYLNLLNKQPAFKVLPKRWLSKVLALFPSLTDSKRKRPVKTLLNV